MRFLGIDLAWAEGSDARPARDSGVVALDQSGKVVDAGWTNGLGQTQAWIAEFGQADTLLFVDAPLVVDNPSGQRLCERRVGRCYGRWKVSPPTRPTSSPLAWLACACGSDSKPWAGAMMTADLARLQAHRS
jgi:predicted RNase H-like nuclease